MCIVDNWFYTAATQYLSCWGRYSSTGQYSGQKQMKWEIKQREC